MKRFVILLAVLAVTTGFLFAGGTQEPGGVKPTLTLAVPWAPGTELDQFLPVVKAFETKENVSIKILTYRAEDLSTILPAQLDAGQALADIIFMWDWWVKKNSKYAADLSDVWNPVKPVSVAPAVEADGKVVMVPYQLTVKPGFWYRKSFFQANGLKVPTTWDEFKSLLDAISKVQGIKNPIVSGDGTGWPLTDVTEHFIATYGGIQMDRDLIAGKIAWTDPAVKKVFTDYLVPLLQSKAFSDPIEWTQAVELWWSGDYGLYFMGNWITGMVKDSTDLGVFPLPGAKAIVAGPDYPFIPLVSQNQALAKKFLAYMLSADGQTIRAQAGGKLVIRKDVSPTLYPKADQAVAAVMASMDTTLQDVDDTIGGDWQRLFWDQLKLLWVQPSSLDDMLSKLQAAMPKPQ